VVIDSFDFHRRACNHAALAAAGIDERTPDPPGGHIVRDAAGRPTGELIDSARGLLDSVMPPWTHDEDEEAIRRAGDHFAALGFTHVTNAAPLTMSRFGEEVAAFLRLHKKNDLRLRFSSMLRIDLAGAAVDLGIAPGFGDEWFSLAGLKIFADGALGPRTADLDEPYEGTTTTGSPSMGREELTELVASPAAAGWQICVHAQGNAATRTVAQVLSAHPPAGGGRHRIEHCSLTNADAISSMAAGHITPVPQLGFLRYRSADFLASLGPERLADIFPLRRWIDAGLRPLHSSDAPVIEDARPMPAIATAIGRADDRGRVWGADQGVTFDEALAMVTSWPAEASGEENRRGRIAPGYLADFTMFDVELRHLPPGDLAAVQPVGTIVGGSFVWRAEQ
jgi:predicted amidohydrolase YtcJ